MSISQINPPQLRPSGDDGGGAIIQVTADRLNEAVGRLLATGGHADPDHVQHFLNYARDHRIDLTGLWARVDHRGRIVASVLTVPSPGRTAMVFASRPWGSAQVPVLAALIRHACAALVQHDVCLAQVLLEPTERLEHTTFRQAGFADLATLSYLERPIGIRGPRASQVQWPQGLTVVSAAESSDQEMLDALDRSYEDTLDCPGLRGHRHTCDILAGHRGTGCFDPKLWCVLRERDRAIGVLLLNGSVDRQSIELVYLGLIKSARGRGFGRLLLRHGFYLVSTRSERMMNLAVDESNVPAVSLYIQEGFKHVMRRRAMIYPLP